MAYLVGYPGYPRRSIIEDDGLQTPAQASIKRTGLRTHIVALVASALLPAFAVGAIAVNAAVGSYRRAFEDRLQSTAAALASAIGSEIETYTAALSALATSTSLDSDTPDLVSFQQRAGWVAADLDSRIFLINPDGTMPLHTDFPFGTDVQSNWSVGQTSDVARRVFEAKRFAVGDAISGQMSGRLLTPVYVPVMRSGQAIYALGSVIESQRLSRLLAAQGFEGGIYASLIDTRGSIVARSMDQEQYIGQQVRDWITEGVKGHNEGVLNGTNLAGARISTGFHRVTQFSDWIVTVAAPDAAFYASLWTPLVTLALGSLGSLTLSLIVATRLGHRILVPVDWLTRKAERVASSGGRVEVVPVGPPVRVQEFERLRAAVVQAHLVLQEQAAAVAAGEARLRAVVETAVDAIVVTDGTGIIKSLNAAAEVIFGYTQAEAVGESVLILMHAASKAKLDNLIAIARVQPQGQHEKEGRRKDGSVVPIELSVSEWLDEIDDQFLTWIMRDISARKAAEEQRVILAREVDHRAKNVLAVVQSVLRLSPCDSPKAFVAAVEARVSALARVHSLLAENAWAGADLRSVAERELAAYTQPHVGTRGPGQGTTSLNGPFVTLVAAAVQPMAMLLHELATNAAKYGAMSVPGGLVEVCWRLDDAPTGDKILYLRWSERGGPPVQSSPARRGFGSRVIEATVRHQLGGTVERHWRLTGLVVEVIIPLERAVAGLGGRTVATSEVA
ncbi:PAS domain S-box protein [Belnapia sp. T18]|uniref:histidine kinase n=1 Tax=Belnapia arida TaxID=2804533 RepID=A0ABS1UD50_9PROT|nr:PAS domain S-box protein [Belnapia arida]MBL6082440.1 PAS domain S-box protein [Belnapia arida]